MGTGSVCGNSVGCVRCHTRERGTSWTNHRAAVYNNRVVSHRFIRLHPERSWAANHWHFLVPIARLVGRDGEANDHRSKPAQTIWIPRTSREYFAFVLFDNVGCAAVRPHRLSDGACKFANSPNDQWAGYAATLHKYFLQRLGTGSYRCVARFSQTL